MGLEIDRNMIIQRFNEGFEFILFHNFDHSLHLIHPKEYCTVQMLA
jgi:hypothetical protein